MQKFGRTRASQTSWFARSGASSCRCVLDRGASEIQGLAKEHASWLSDGDGWSWSIYRDEPRGRLHFTLLVRALIFADAETPKFPRVLIAAREKIVIGGLSPSKQSSPSTARLHPSRDVQCVKCAVSAYGQFGLTGQQLRLYAAIR